MAFLIYGATGYTGKLVAKRAKELGLEPVLAGRNEDKLRAVAEPLGFAYQAFDLSDTDALENELKDVNVVLHIAGPFSATSKPMVDACIKMGTHYLDITGEIDVFEALSNRDAEAKAANIMLLPGVGFDVVPSDCLAAHLKGRMPDAKELEIFIEFSGRPSRGTAKTGVESIAIPARVRRNGDIISLGAPQYKEFLLGNRSQKGVSVSWGDVSTAYHSTHIPNITIYFGATKQIKQMADMPKILRKLFATSLGQRFLKAQIDKMPEGPSDEERATAETRLLGIAQNEKGEIAQTLLTTPDGYTLTAETALEIVCRVEAGHAKPGFQTPSRVFGPDFITGFVTCMRQDLSV